MLYILHRELTLADRVVWALIVISFLAVASALTWNTWTQWQGQQGKMMWLDRMIAQHMPVLKNIKKS